MRLAFAIACVGMVGVAIACNSGSGNGQGPATNGGAFAADFCNLIEPCCAQAGLGTTGTLCQAFASSAAAKGNYDPTAGQACISGMQAESGTPALCANLGNDVPACSNVFTSKSGAAPGGAPCTQDSDCAKAAGGSATCFSNFAFGDGGSTQTQTCIQTTVGQAGDGPCIGTVEATGTFYTWSGSGAPPASGVTCAIASGLTCDSTTQKCKALGTTGQACQTASDCVASDYCAYSGSADQCAARLADGAPCGAVANGCATTSYCDMSANTCKPLVPTGSACTASPQCSSGQCVNSKCGAGNNFGLQLLCGM